MEEKIESECMEAIRVSLEQERAIEIRATYEDLNLIKKWKSESSSKERYALKIDITINHPKRSDRSL